MEAIPYDGGTLGQVDDTFYFGADCQKCARSQRLSLVRLRALLGDDFLLVDIRPLLKCSACGSRRIVTAYLPPNAKGAFPSLFAEIAA